MWASAPWDASAAACLCSCFRWFRRSCRAFSMSSTLARCCSKLFWAATMLLLGLLHAIVGRFEVSPMHGNLVLTCSNPLAEGHGLVTGRLCLVQLCSERLDCWVVVGEQSSCLQLSKGFDRHFVCCLRRRICLSLAMRILRTSLSLVEAAPTPSPVPPLWPTPSSTWLAVLASLISP